MNHIQEARILLVDDNPDILEMLNNMLSRRGFRSVQTAIRPENFSLTFSRSLSFWTLCCRTETDSP